MLKELFQEVRPVQAGGLCRIDKHRQGFFILSERGKCPRRFNSYREARREFYEIEYRDGGIYRKPRGGQ